jgi:tetratricopeptide (TPR) repeat protein
MRRFFPILNLAFVSLVFLLPSAAQTANSAGQGTPEALTATYNQAMQAKDWPTAVAAAQQLVALNATAENLRLLGNAQLYNGAADDALATYDRALSAANQDKPAPGQPDTAWKDEVSKIYVGKGNGFLKLKRNPEAIDAYNRSAELASNPGLAYFNVCAVMYNIGDTQNSAAACRKSVQADPSRANAWFVLGSDLFADAPIDASGKVSISAETRQALEKYLELDPNGSHADDVKAMLQMAAK